MKETKQNGNGIPDAFAAYLNSIKDHKPLSSEEEINICIKAQNGDLKAREMLINNNLQIVIKLAMYISKCNENLMDLIQEGNIALIKAVDNFNPNLGFRFSTFAYSYVLNIIKVKAAFHNHLLYVPDYAHWNIVRIKNAINNLISNSESITIDNIIKETDLPEQTILTCLPYLENYLSLDHAYNTKNGDDDHILQDYIASPENIIDDYIHDISLSDALNSVFKKMKERDLIFIKMYYGLDGFATHTLQQIGDEFGITRERVRQIIAKAEKKIKQDKDIRDIFFNQY